MDRLSAIAAFRAVVDHGGYAAASRAVGRSKTALSKAVADLESELGVRLLQRSTRRIALTDPGRQFHGRCVLLLADLEDAESEARNAQTNVRGQIRLVAPQTFGETFLMPVLGEFLTKESEITLDLMLTDRFVDLVEERFDLAVRIADLPDSSLVARRLGDMQLVLCAAPAYLAAHGVPSAPAMLAAHQCIIDTNLSQPRHWLFSRRGRALRVPVSGRVQVNGANAARAMALAGHGVALCPDFVVTQELAAGRLVPLLNDYQTAPRGIYAVYPHRRHLPIRVRALIDFLARRLGGALGAYGEYAVPGA